MGSVTLTFRDAMCPPRRLYPSSLAALALLAGGCHSFELERTRFAIISVPATAVAGGGYATKPTAFFFEGSGIQLSSTQLGDQGCLDRPFAPVAPAAFTRIDAGAAVEVNLGGTDATLSPAPSLTGTTYRLPDEQSIPFTPGNEITLTIPGAVGGFPARVVRARTVEAFTPGPVAIPASTTDDLELTWTPVPSLPGSAMFYSFRYAATASASIDREIACVFADDGTGFVPATTLSGFRNSGFRSVTAQRALISFERVGSAITHVTSTLLVPVPVVGAG